MIPIVSGAKRCTIMVLISYCGGYLGYAPLTARRACSDAVG